MKANKGGTPPLPPCKRGVLFMQKTLCKLRKNLLTQLVKKRIEKQKQNTYN